LVKVEASTGSVFEGALKESESTKAQGGIAPLLLVGVEIPSRVHTGAKVVKQRTLQEEENRRLEAVE
jgi:hypothetical protein